MMTLPMSPVPAKDDLVPDRNVGLRHTPAIRGTNRQTRGVDFFPDGEQLATDRFRALDKRAERGRRRGRRKRVDGDDGCGVDRIGEERRQGRLSACAVRGGRAPIGVDVQHFALRTEAIESGRITGGLAPGQHLGQLTQAIA